MCNTFRHRSRVTIVRMILSRALFHGSSPSQTFSISLAAATCSKDISISSPISSCWYSKPKYVSPHLHIPCSTFRHHLPPPISLDILLVMNCSQRIATDAHEGAQRPIHLVTMRRLPGPISELSYTAISSTPSLVSHHECLGDSRQRFIADLSIFLAFEATRCNHHDAPSFASTVVILYSSSTFHGNIHNKVDYPNTRSNFSIFL